MNHRHIIVLVFSLKCPVDSFTHLSVYNGALWGKYFFSAAGESEAAIA